MSISKLFAKATKILLEAEVAPDRRVEFEQRYRDLAETTTPKPGEFYKIQPNKWGIECRIYFDASEEVISSLADLGLNVEHRQSGYRSDNRPYRINNNDVFWELVRLGYRLGGEQAG